MSKLPRHVGLTARPDSCQAVASPTDGPQVHEVAVPATCAGVLLVLPAGGLSEVCHRAELHLQRWQIHVKAMSMAVTVRQHMLSSRGQVG